MILLLAGTLGANSQSIQDQIDRDVWHKFKKAFDADDMDALLEVHVEDVIRINRDGQYILVGKEYEKHLRQSALRNDERGAVRTIDFSFTERIATKGYAYERGFYRASYAAGGQERITYGQFDAILKKEGGVWKIVADSDTSEDGQVREEDFMSGVMLSSPPPEDR